MSETLQPSPIPIDSNELSPDLHGGPIAMNTELARGDNNEITFFNDALQVTDSIQLPEDKELIEGPRWGRAERDQYVTQKDKDGNVEAFMHAKDYIDTALLDEADTDSHEALTAVRGSILTNIVTDFENRSQQLQAIDLNTKQEFSTQLRPGETLRMRDLDGSGVLDQIIVRRNAAGEEESIALDRFLKVRNADIAEGTPESIDAGIETNYGPELKDAARSVFLGFGEAGAAWAQDYAEGTVEADNQMAQLERAASELGIKIGSFESDPRGHQMGKAALVEAYSEAELPPKPAHQSGEWIAHDGTKLTSQEAEQVFAAHFFNRVQNMPLESREQEIKNLEKRTVKGSGITIPDIITTEKLNNIGELLQVDALISRLGGDETPQVEIQDNGDGKLIVSFKTNDGPNPSPAKGMNAEPMTPYEAIEELGRLNINKPIVSTEAKSAQNMEVARSSELEKLKPELFALAKELSQKAEGGASLFGKHIELGQDKIDIIEKTLQLANDQFRNSERVADGSLDRLLLDLNDGRIFSAIDFDINQNFKVDDSINGYELRQNPDTGLAEAHLDSATMSALMVRLKSDALRSTLQKIRQPYRNDPSETRNNVYGEMSSITADNLRKLYNYSRLIEQNQAAK